MKPKKILNLLKKARVQAELSPDKNTQVGAIIVDESGGDLLSSYNGFISGAPDDRLPNEGQDKYRFIIHAEENAICRAAKYGIALNNMILICTLSPCTKCMRLMYQSGIRTVYFQDKYKDFDLNLDMKDLKINLHKFDNYYKLNMETSA